MMDDVELCEYCNQPAKQGMHFHNNTYAALPPAMTWTIEKPTKPGWYWWRHGAVREVVHIKLSPAGFPNMERIGTDQYSPRYHDEGNEWCGPLRAPEEA